MVFSAIGGMVAPASALDVREALGHFESGASTPAACAADRLVGSKREISRFQILPSVWRQYSQSKSHQNPDVAWSVAEQILRDREQQFRRATGRQWDAIDLYIMWNAPGTYRRAKWNRSKVPRIVLDRAQRFANLIDLHRDRLYARSTVE
jgi:hypothetical protein